MASHYDKYGHLWVDGKRQSSGDLQFITVRREASGASWLERIPITPAKAESIAREYFQTIERAAAKS